MNKILLIAAVAMLTGTAFAKLPTPALTDEAKAKAAEAAAKAAHGNKVANYQLCKSMDTAAASYFKSAKATGKIVKPATETPPCVDPGAFVYSPPAAPATTAAPAAPAPVAAATPTKPVTPAAPVKK